MITDYQSLQVDMQKFMKRQDLSALVPEFIAFAESHFDRNIYTRNRLDTFVVTPSTTQVSLPSDWCRIKRAYYNGKTLGFFPSDFQSGYANGENHHIGYGYQIDGNTLSLSVPQLGQTLWIDYYTIIEPLSDTNTSNWLLEDAPDIYLAGALFQAFEYMRSDGDKAYWQAKRDTLIADMQDDDDKSQVPEQPLIMRRA